MLFTLGLLLLLTPFPSIQTTTNEKRDSTGSDVTKPNAAFTLSKPKTTSTLAKQTIRPTLKPNTVNQTVLPTPAANQKPLTVNATATTKSKAGPAISHTTQSAAVKAATGITTKDKHTSSGNQTVVAKSPSTSEVKANKDKPVPTVAPNVQSSSAKSASASSTKATKDIKDKVQPSVNQTVSVKSPSATDGKTAKDKSNPTVIQNVQSTSTKSAPASAAKTSKSKPTASVNQTVVAKSPSTGDVKTSKDKSAPTTVQTPLSTPAKTATASGSSADKDKVAAPANRTTVTKAPTTTTAAPTTAAATANTTPKEKPAPSQPIKVVISDGCDSSKAKEQELQLKPGAPLVMTHKISLLPGGCTGGCESEMAALKVRLARLEKEMSQLKDKCPCSASCPDDCSGNGECEKGKCVCHQGFVGPDCSKCAQGVVCNKKATKGKAKETVEVVTMQKNDQKKETEAKNDQKETEAKNDQKETEAKNNQKETEAKNDQKKEAEAKTDQKKATEAKEQDSKARVATNVKPVLVKTQAKQEVSVKKIAVKGSSTTAKTNRPTVGQVLLKHEGRKQEEARKGKTTVLSSKKVVQKPDLKLVKEGTAGKTFPKSDQLKDEPHTNVTQGNVKKSNGTAKIVTLLTKSVATNKTRTGKETLEQSTLVQKNVTQSSGQKRVQTVKVETTNVQSVDSRNTEAGKAKVNLQSIDNKITEAGKAKVNIQSVDNKITETGKVKVNVQSVDNKNTEAGKVKVNVQSVDNKNTEAGKVKVNVQSVDNKNTEAGKVKVNVQSVDNKNTEAGKVKVTQRSQYIVNTTIAATSDEARVLQNKTSVHVSGTTKGKGGSGLGSVKIVNISSYSFTITWSAPQGMFKNFTVIRREPRTEGDEDDHEEYEEEALEGDKTFVAKNPSEIQITAESTNMTASSGKTTGSRTKAETKRISMSVPGNVRSVEFSNLRANTRYFLHIYGTSAERRSKIHRVSAVTGPEPATDMVFSNVTESSLTVSWAKPKTTFTGFRVTYTNIVTGESRFIVVNSQQSHMVLSKLSAGSSYIISVTSTQGRVQSDALVSVITTVPAPPTHLQVVNVTDTRALLQWTPSLGKVDRFIISYESSKTPNVTVTVMLSGNAVEHQLRGLQRGTLYTVKVLSQKDSHQSMAISTTFTTANVVKASEVGARSAVITWRTSTVVYHSYRVIYQVAGEETKEVILDPTLTEYKLTGLLPMSRYIVLVQGERDGRYTSVVTTEFITGKLRFPFPTECSQELLNGALQSGEVDIYPQGKEGQAVKVYCDMETDGGGWTVFQRRLNGKTDFYKTWSEYSAGFGNLSDEFWLGNELLHNLTSVGPVSLRVDLRSGNDTAYAHYANFSIDSEEKHYTLTVTGYTGTAGDSMRYHNGRPFSTRDKNPDSLGIHCARAYMGGWWYKNCYKTNLNGLYGINSNNQGIVWIDWKGKDSSIPFTEMKFRPSRFSPATHG